MRTHLIAYTARTATGVEKGIARITSDRSQPSWADVARVVPGFFTGQYIGLAPDSETVPMFTLRYERDGLGQFVKKFTREGMEAFGAKLMGEPADAVFNIEVLNEAGTDVTFDFACFS